MQNVNCLILALCIGFGYTIGIVQTVSAADEMPTVGQYQVYELSLTSGQYRNPYVDVSLVATFTGPDMQSYQIEGFWNGGTEFKVRFAPTQTGTWTYNLVSNDTLMNGRQGAFECVASAHPGFLHTQNFAMRYANGDPFFRMGDTCWRMFRSKNAAFETHFKPYIDARSQQGFNTIWATIHTVGDPSINEGGSLWYQDTDLNRLQPGYFDWVDARIDYMLNNHIVPGLIFAWSTAADDFTSSQYERYLRYVIARYAAYQVIWGVTVSYQSTLTPSDWDQYAQIVKQYDPYDHPLTILPSLGHSNSEHFSAFSDWLDIISQQYDGDYATLHQAMLQDRAFGLFTENDLFGYEGPLNPGDPYYYYNNRDGEGIRKAAWSIVMAGGSLTYGNMYTYTGKEFEIRTDKLQTPGALAIDHLTDFWQSRPFYRLSPSDQWMPADDFCLARQDSLYIIYSLDATLEIDLSHTPFCYDVTWFDPATGTEYTGATFCGGTSISLTAPFSGDAVATLSRSFDEIFVQASVRSEPLGLDVIIDGDTLTTPQVFTWRAEDTHTLDAVSPQQNQGVEYTFQSWSDGGAKQHLVLVPETDTTFVARFDTSGYYLDPDFTADPLSGIAPLRVEFTDQTIGKVETWAWDFGDGSPNGNDTHPAHSYQDPGDYTVTLTVTGPAGSESISKQHYIHVDPVPDTLTAQFNAEPLNGFSPHIVRFTDQSVGTVTDWAWDFGDASASTLQNPCHVYWQTGDFDVSLLVSNTNTSDTHLERDFISVSMGDTSFCDDFGDGLAQEWIAEGGAWSVINGDLDGDHASGRGVLLAPVGNVKSGAVESDIINLSEGVTYDGQMVFGYSHAGDYRFLEMSSDKDQWILGEYIAGQRYQRAIWSRPILVDRFYHVVLNFNSTGLVSFAVDSLVIGKHNFAKDLTGFVGCGVDSSNSRFDNFCFNGAKELSPVARFTATPRSGYVPLEVSFSDESYGQPTTWQWDFGDGSALAYSQNPVHTYSEPGQYTVTLTVYNSHGSDQLVRTHYIESRELPPPPIADFDVDQTTVPFPGTVHFQSLASGVIDNWHWEFGDGQTIDLENPYHTYETPGLYSVTLIVSGPGGTDTLTVADLITVMDQPAEYETHVYEPIDILLSGSASDNPYMQYQVNAQYLGPGGEELYLQGFWIGDNGWTLRFAPTTAGTWTLTTASADPELDGKSFTIQAFARNHPGFLTVQGRHFYRQNGIPFFRLGDTCWRMFRSKNAPFETHFKPYVDARAAQGFNMIYGVIHTVYDSTINEGGALWPGDGDLDRLQPGFFEWVDKRIEYLNDQGIVAGIVFVWAQTFDDFTVAQFDRFMRYVVARYSAYDVMWIMSGEYTETMTPADYDLHARTLDQIDPYDHPISIHPGGKQSNSQDYPLFASWLDYLMQQIWGPADTLYQHIMQDYDLGLPVCNDEFGYEGPTDPADPFYYPNNQTPEQIRRSAWTLLASGAYMTYGNIYTYTGKERIIQLDKLNTPGAHYMSVLENFVENQIPFHRLTPDTVTVRLDGYCISQPDSFYLVYVPDSSEVSLDLLGASGYFKARWLNPRTGESLDAGFLEGDIYHTLGLPDEQDWVLTLQRYSGALLQIKCFLEGPFLTDSLAMRTDLGAQGFLPLTSPHSDTKLYPPHLSDVVDFIGISLRQGATGPLLASQSALLIRNGEVRGGHQGTALAGFDVSADSAFVVLHHRNHLDIMSAAKIALPAEQITLVDLSLSDSIYGMPLAAKELAPGLWGMWTGDANNNGQVQIDDKNLFWRQQVGTSGYRSADFNLNGQVQVDDKNMFWRLNVGKGSQVPAINP
ncbi:DUF4038 domain-containing protein [candidate division KSB1 bacterium]|nr:DUF4038 domain-containing protein [candidate division KSB1 bacterium]